MAAYDVEIPFVDICESLSPEYTFIVTGDHTCTTYMW